MKVIFDCDNTFGIKDCDVDDGLALLYLLGSDAVELLGITTTFGNNRTETVYDNTLRMLGDLKRTDIPVYKGGDKPIEDINEASDFLLDMANRYPDEISVLATGSLTNLYGAYVKDKNFFKKLKSIVLMGGITEPLVFEKKVMNELNFSVDHIAAYTVLTEGKNVSVITGNNCLKVLFTKDEYKERLSGNNNIGKYILEETDYWFAFNREDYGIKGFYNWDVTAAVFLVHPELFTDVKGRFSFSVEDMKTGYLHKADYGKYICNLPEICDEESFKNSIYSTWFNVKI